MLITFQNLRGCKLEATDGDIGIVNEIYFDDEHWIVRYFVVDTSSWFTNTEVLIAPCALSEIDPQSQSIAVALTREQVRSAPLAETDKPVSRQYEKRFYKHYDWDPHWIVPGAVPGIMAAHMNPSPDPIPDVPEPQTAEQQDQEKYDPHLRSSKELLSGYSIHAQDGEIGKVKDIFIDDSEWHVRYLVIHTGILFLGKMVLLSPAWIEHISHERSEVFVNLPRSSIKEAPDYDARAPVSRAFEQRLHDHYGRKSYWDSVKSAHNS